MAEFLRLRSEDRVSARERPTGSKGSNRFAAEEEIMHGYFDVGSVFGRRKDLIRRYGLGH